MNLLVGKEVIIETEEAKPKATIVDVLYNSDKDIVYLLTLSDGKLQKYSIYQVTVL